MYTGIYIHIPFCRSKCFYCDFKSFVCKKDSLIENKIALYIQKLTREIESCNEIKNTIVKSIFIGGGTPSIVSHSNIYKILRAIDSSCGALSRNIEITLEANPESLDQEKIFAYKSYGVNRISIGLQAIQNRLLKKIGRAHDFETFEKAYEITRKKFDNVNLDLIFGLPDQSVSDWEETLRYIKKISPEHLSAYSLIIESGTKFYKHKTNLNLPDESTERQMYYLIKDILGENYYQYEISNFAREKKFECRHNKLYWNLENYLGFGLGSHSFFKNTRWHNTYSLKNYLSDVKCYCEDVINTSDKALIEEFMFLGLRLNQGVSKNRFRKKFGYSIDSFYHDQIILLESQKLVAQNEYFIFLTDHGRDLANYVMSKFLFDRAP